MVLSNKQKDDLHCAILGYLNTAGFPESAAAFTRELTAINDKPPVLDDTHSELLEKKWTSLIRMQKKILDLEQTNEQLREDLSNAGKGRKVDLTTALPRSPARCSLLGHRDVVTTVLFHPHYSLLFSASEDATIRVWDTDNGRFERSLQGHQDSVTSLAIAPNGNILASASADLSIKLWDIENQTYTCVKTLLGHDHTVSSVSYTPTGDFLISASRDKSIKVWDSLTGFCVRTLVGHDQWVRHCIVSPCPINLAQLSSLSTGSGSVSQPAQFIIASCSMDQTIRIWNMKTGDCLAVLNEHTHVVEHLAFSNSLADIAIDEMRNEEQRSSSKSVVNSPAPLTAYQRAQASLAAANATSSLSIPPNGTRSPSPSLSQSSNSQSVIQSSGGSYLLSASRDKSIKLWHVLTQTCIRTFNVHENWVQSVLFHPSGRFFLSAGDDKTIRCFDFQKQGKCVKTIENAHSLFVTSIDWNPVTPMMASGSVDHSISLWDCR